MKEKRQALFIICHPKPDSFCHALAQTARETAKQLGWESRYLDLYQEDFSPVLSLEELQRKTSFDPLIGDYEKLLLWCTDLLFFYPDWWGGPPALLKGWLDRVFRPGIAYDYRGLDEGPKVPIGLLTDKRAWVYVTRDSRSEETAPKGLRGKLISQEKQNAILPNLDTSHHRIWIDSIQGFTGLNILGMRVFGPMYQSRITQRREWLKQCRQDIGGSPGK